MIEYFCTDEQTRSLVKLDKEKPGCWIALFEPTDEELSEITRRFGIEEDDLCAPLDLEEVSRIERNDIYTMFIVDTPVHDKTSGENATPPFLSASSKRRTTSSPSVRYIAFPSSPSSSHVSATCIPRTTSRASRATSCLPRQKRTSPLYAP